MTSLDTTVPFFVKIEGQPYSNHRNPQGIYRVDVVKEKTLAHSACAAMQVARDSVPFFDENPDCFTLRAFREDGTEVVIPRMLYTTHEDKGRFHGRSKDHPEAITLQ